MASAKKFREYAEECRRIAQQLPPNQKAALLEIAEAWLRCAEDEERESGRRKDDE